MANFMSLIMKKTSKRIVFFGNEKLASGLKSAEPIIKNALIGAGYEIEQVVTGPMDSLKPHKAKVAVLAAYGRIIPQSVLDEFPLGIINVHPSLLPLHRGPAPIESVILNGEQKTGVSIMKLGEKMDAGPVFGFSELALKGDESKQFLASKLSEVGAEMLVELLPEIINQTILALPQDDSKATYDNLIKKSDGEIKWNESAEQIERKIRAYKGWPKSYTTLGDISVIISDSEILNSNGKPSEIELNNSSELIVFAGKNALKINRLQPAGKKEMTAKDFLLGYKSRLVI